MKFKQLALVLLALTIMVVAAGCGKKEDTNPAASPTPGTNTPAVDKVKVSITSWRSEQSEQDLYKAIQAELNKTSPEIELEFKPVKATEYNTTLNVALKTNTAADIIHLRPYAGAKALADANYLEPIDGLKGLDVFTDAQLLAAQGTDGKQYGVPYMLSSTQILYNKKVFADNNLTEPATWADLIKIADTLKEKKITPFAFGSKEGWVLSLMHGAIGPQFYGPDFIDKFLKGEVTLDSPEFLKSVEAMKSLTPYFPNNFEGLGMEDIRTMFATGQTGMVINGHFEIASILALNPDLEIGAFPVPPVDAGGKASVSTWVDGSFGINKESKNKEAAKKVLEFMTTETYGNMILNATKSPSPIPGVKTDDELTNKIAQLSATNAVPYFAVTYLNSGNPTTKATLEGLLQGMYLNKLTPEQVVKDAQKNVDTWFKPAGK
ncbi:ABC transporter substrate-binding protein [Paenibacillus eucommiae]|uniref:Raffinose/stachyose/melibiose transport system substrate-binding protein n=1 Tax=Paenibacillus eucommiae TaxID=1355755 RepID=A0ABS4J2W3_9BACL|nr:extracellular solute-binding protein [Paenibacillus eucommiae]MBP1993149.1 raffinose/stachyose/melibiose transport system substrate-binding protein [Paenibacillus eucommiae]